MRTIPYNLLQKINTNLQAESTDAKPALRVVATQAASNTLLTEIIHADEAPAYGDVAIRQLAGERSPKLAYAVCVDEGVATVYERELPAYIDKRWTKLFTLGLASDVAMEYRGNWVIDTRSQCYYLQTELTPYIFLVIDGSLYVQKWNDDTTRYLLATDVVHISACQAWKSADEPLLDQGLIVGYIKTNGAVYYRAFKELTLGEFSWDLEQSVEKLGTRNVSINVFRTNDFRFGILCESEDSFHYVLSHRTYAGQSVKPEAVYAQVRLGTFRMFQVFPSSVNDGAHYVDAAVPGLAGYVGYYKTLPTFSVEATSRPSDHEFLMTASHDLIERLALLSYVRISIDSVVTTMPKLVSAVVSGNTIRLATDIDISPWQQVTITVYGESSLRYREDDTSFLLIGTFFVVFPPEAGWDDHPSLNADIALTTLDYFHVDHWVGGRADHETLTATVSGVSLVMTMVGPVPV